MRRVGVVSAYQDAKLLVDCFQALDKICDRILYIDGAYREFEFYNNTPVSTDGSLEIASDFADIVVKPYSIAHDKYVPWPDEIVKRNQYMQLGYPGDVFLVVDADEIPEGSLNPQTLDQAQDWGVDIYREEEPKTHHPIHRLFHWREGIAYRGTHHAVHVGDKLIHPSRPPLPVFPDLRLRHRQHLRDRERVEKKGAYYRVLTPSERAFRQTWGL